MIGIYIFESKQLTWIGLDQSTEELSQDARVSNLNHKVICKTLDCKGFELVYMYKSKNKMFLRKYHLPNEGLVYH